MSRDERFRLAERLWMGDSAGAGTDLATLRARHAQLCEQINEEATPFRESPNRVACAERDRLWEQIVALTEDSEDE